LKFLKKAIEEEIQSENLVPGDIIEVKNMSTMHCDAVLLNGNVIVNESILTGESVPITKTPIPFQASTPSTKLHMAEHSRHILFSGTQVIQKRNYGREKTRCLVIRTGFNTTKGELIRSILYPKPVDYGFNNDTYKYLAGLSIIAIAGMIYTLIVKIQRDVGVREIILRVLAVVTTVVPPALPSALTACLVYAQDRLKKKDIYCISPSSINLCGTLNCFVFDKTGTLTEDGLDLKFVMPLKSQNKKEFGKLVEYSKNLDQGDLIEAMATCHSLTYINGELAGDPLDLKMFEFTRWDLIEATENEAENFDKITPAIVRSPGRERELALIKQFPFSSSLQRMSVVTKGLEDQNFMFYVKGSPEKIFELSKSDTSNLFLI
jgi:cation-transporting P-type ATPase 13A2